MKEIKLPRFVSLVLVLIIVIISLILINAQNNPQININNQFNINNQLNLSNKIINLNKQEYKIGEIVEILINLDSYENINVDLYTPNAIYKYPYASNIIRYMPNSEGRYRILISEKNQNKNIIATETFYVSLSENNLNENSNLNEITKDISSENITNINNKEKNNLLEDNLMDSVIVIEKETYSLGEEVLIYINKSDLSTLKLVINTPYGKFNYIELKTNFVRFLPKTKGQYSIVLNEDNKNKKIFVVDINNTISNIKNKTDNENNNSFENEDKNKIINEKENEENKEIETDNNLISNNLIPELLTEIKDKTSFKIKNSKGYYLIANITLSNEKLRNISFDTLSVLNIPNEKYNVEIDPKIRGIKKIKLNNVSFSGNFNLGLEEIDYQKANFKDLKKAIAIDPTNVNFTNGFIEINASSDVLLKCKDWNFTEQKCYGNFQLLENLEKGKTYFIEINSTDPAYYELGLASINTNKSLYKENETMQIWITALDYTGHLISNANISLQIISPNNEIFYYTTDNNITQIELGIYELNFTTKEHGNYTIFANVYSNLINTTLFSYFSVLDYYDFEIIRKSPLTTDPWRDSFTTKLKVISNLNSSNLSLFNLTEKIPISFEIIETNALITNDSNYYYLTWQISNNTEVNYTAVVPFITPALYELKSYIKYELNNETENFTKIFNEAKPWFLAVDPIMYAQSCQAQDNSVGQNTFASSCDGTYPGSCGATGDLLTCNDGFYETMASANNNRWSGVRISAYDSTITDCISITNVQLCYEWWRDTGYNAARIAVDRNNWASPTTVTTTLPGTTANPGVTCNTVTGLEAWTCDNFDGTGTAAQAVAQVQRDNSGGGNRNLYVDVLFFNVTYLRDYPPNITQNQPSSYYYNDTFSPINLTFNCSAVDDIRVNNISLYITNLNNNSFSLNQTCNISTSTGSCQWTLLLATGNYTWNCLSYDNRTQGTWGLNRTIVINYTEPAKPLIHSYQCEINTLNNWQPCNSISYGNTILRVRTNCSTESGSITNASFLLYNLPDATYLLNGTTTSETSGFYIFDNDDLNLTDSGYFNLSVQCFNSYNKNQTNTTAWNFAWGYLTSQLIYPTDSIQVPQNSTFNFTSKLTCVGGECGDVNATLDPLYLVIFNHTFDENTQNFTWIDDIYGTNQPAQSDGYLTNRIFCPNGNCLFGDLHTVNNSNTGPWSGGFNKTFNLTPYTYGLNANITINITFDYNLIIDQVTEAGEFVYLYYRNISSKAAIQGPNIQGSGAGGTDEVFENSSGRISLIFYNVSDVFSFDVGCYMTDTNANDEDGGCFIDNILVQAKVELNKGKVSNVSGTKPFWTFSPNPYTEAHLTCLRNMISGQQCNTTWVVNATGPLFTTWEFFVLYEPTEYQSYLSFNKSKSVNITITDVTRPVITSLQCQRNSTSWVSCDLIKYNEFISGVRGTCYYTEGSLDNMYFKLTNQFHNRIYFEEITTDNSTGYWTSLFSPIRVNTSGLFELYTRCYSNSVFADYQQNWTLPFGTLEIKWINLTNEVNVTRNKFSNFSVILTCQGGECINNSAFIDPEIGQQFALITLDGTTNFPLRDGLCNTATDTCTLSNPWDDFDNCIAGNGAYGICASKYAGAGGTDRGLLCQGCDRNNGGNTGGLYISLNSTPCGGFSCQQIYLSYYQAVQSMDAANEGSVVLVRDNDGIWRQVSRCIDNDLCDCDRIAGCTLSTIGQYAEYVNVNLCDIPGIDCNQPLDIFFTSYATTVNQGTGDYFMWDQINVTGILPKGIIPYGSGAPFYTSYANPVYRQNNSCLAYLDQGQSCEIKWPVNATGSLLSVHDFYVNATSYNNQTTESSIINVRIVENQIPYVTNVSLKPLYPSSSDDLNCSFIVNDANYFDILYANVTWYRNNLIYFSTIIPVENHKISSNILSYTNTANGEIWHCGITPYDETIYGNQVNSSQVTILVSQPPIISNVQCQRNSTSWVSCSDIKFNDIITMVRAQCSDIDGTIQNVTFNLSNYEDNYLFFKNTTYYEESGYYYFNNTDIKIKDSGHFNLSVSCVDDTNVETILTTTWLVPFGKLKAQWLNPPSIDVNTTRYKLSNFSVRIACEEGECGNVTAILDPFSSYIEANLTFETPTNFPLAAQCGTGAGWQCSDSSPWDDFDNCIGGSGVYGICASTEANAGENSLRGLECRGCDRADALNQGGLYIEIPSRSCNDYICEQINISFYQIVQSMDSASEGSAVFVRDEDGIWRNLTTCMDGQPNCDCDSILGCTRAEMGAYAQFFKKDLCQVSGINCSQNITLFFTSYNAINHATDDYFAWDNILVEKFGEKGIIPVGSGFPFYVIENNPRTWNDFSCLFNMTSGNYCDITWQLNSTGNYNKTHEFFAYFNSSYSLIQVNETKHINVTIRENLQPSVVFASIGPEVALNDTNIYCNFSLTDPNYFDSLFANVSWFRNNTFYFNQQVPVTINTLTQVYLLANNTEPGEYWHCGITPFDGELYGNQLNSSNITIYLYPPPSINSIQCNVNGLWQSCTNVLYYRNFSAIRTNCSSNEGMVNATFNFTNIPDNKLFFNNVTTNYSSGYFIFDFDDINITDSGEMEIYAKCSDNVNQEVKGKVNWTIPWGTLTASLVYPDSDTSVQRNNFFTFEALVSCSGGECGNINATLDPYVNSTLYDYKSGYNIDKFAWVIDSNNNPPESLPNSRTALTNAQINQINVSDNTRYSMPDPGAGDFISLEMIMNLKENRNNITKIQLFFEGYPSIASTIQIYAWNFNTNTWNSLGTQSFSTGSDQYFSVNITSNILNYVNASNNNIRWLLLNALNNEYILVDYVYVNVTYNAYKGIIPREEGAIPFYTKDYNPKDYNNQSCLFNMTSGKNCIVSWLVNATGYLGSTHEFFAYFNATNYSQYIQPKQTSHIFITITDTSQVPPIVILNYPIDGLYTSNQNIEFNCSVTDNTNLKNLSLVADFNGIFQENETYQISGTSNNSLFYKYLEDGLYKWNCLAYDSDNNYDWGNTNRTLIIDTTEPTIILNNPLNESSFTTTDINLNFTAIDALDSVLMCDLYLNGVLYNANVSAINNTPKIISLINLTPNTYKWFLSCADNATNTNISEEFTFYLTDIPPTVTLLTANNYYFNSPNISLDYYATDNWNINVSTLILNGNPYAYQYNLGTSAITNFNLTYMNEGFYNWTINVSDASNLTDQAPFRYFTIDYTSPNVILYAPEDNLTINTTNIKINFTAIDNLDLSLNCNLTINNQIAQTNIPAINNSFVSYSVSNFIDGLNYWNLTCFDDAGNIFTTETRLLNVSAPPSVVLNYPNNNHFQNQQNITLYYTPSDNMNLSVCELFVDNIYNQSNTEIINNQQNTFELSNLIEKTYFWAVRCNDTSNLSAFSETRNFTIDLTKPTIYLLQPNNGDTIYGRWTNFNFSVIDNYDFNLTCNITVDGSVKASNLNVLNNTATNFSVNVSDEGLHTYYITCIDDATNFNVSETRTYTTSNPPEAQLVFPNNNAIINYNLINFTYIPIDNNLANATLILNGIRNETNNTLTDEQENYFRLYLNDGIYNWTVNVTDQSYLYTMPNALSFIVDTTQPLITINHPNAETLDWNNITLNFSVIDNLLEPINCNISIDSALVFTNISINNNTNVIRYYALNDGSHNWQIKCIDLANNTAIASASFIVEAPPRVNLLMPINQTRTKEQQFLFEYKPYDVFGLNNCSLILDSQLNQTNETILNNQNNTFYVAYINEGLHNWTIRCYDNAPDYNLYEPNPYLFRIDLTGPTIILKEPFIDQTFNLNNITFNYTAIDSDNIIIDCNISVSDPFGNRLNFTSMPAGLDHIITIVNLTDGEHYWNVSCVDDLGNYNVSETRRFIINQPDLFLNNSRIYLNNTNPDLNENITIYVNVSNIGGLPVTNLLVNFYDGNPNNGGLFIGNSTNNVGINQTITFKTSWLINEGYHTIYVIADPYNQIAELNETNNNGTINISVLWANITYPKNQTWFNYLTLPINFTAFDYSGDNITYNVLIDNVPNGQTGSIIDASNNSINVTFTQGIRTIKIRVNDSYYYLGNTIQRIKDSLPITLYIDTTPPTINFNTLNLTWFNSEPIINFTITDNLDNLINYSIYVNNNIFTTGATNSTPNLINLTNLENGTHEIFIEAFDEAGNYINSSVLTIYLDSVKPTIYLLGPQNNINLLNNYATFNFSVIDNLDNLLQCNLTIDSQVNVSNINAYNNSINSTTVTNFKEGIHYWNVSCWDGNIITPVSLINTSDTYYFNIFNAPIITLIEPENNNWTNNSEVIFFFNVSEETGLQNCSILLNGQIQNTKQGNLLNKQGLNNITLTNLNGTYNWQIECYDNTTIYNYGISDSRTINVDLDSPIPYIETLNNTWFNYNNPLIYFNITDNMASLINYTFYINSTQNKNGSVNNATSTSVNLNPISDGYYLLTLEAFDLAYNRKNSSQIIIFVDTTKPTIMLENPENGFTTSNTNILFNFTAFDNLAQTMLCNLTIDNQIVQSFNTTNGFYNFTNVVMPAGMHYWNVSCSDSVGNFNTSETRYFIIPLPDLFVSSDYIFFNTTAPEENSNITINATIFNIGNTTAYNVTIQFWDGHYLNGTQINGNFTYNISAGENITINLSWKVPNIGEHKIYVLADPLIQTNGSIVESNETNNYAYKLIIVGSYTYVYGNFTGFLNLKDLTNQTLFKWDINDFNGSKIFAVDYDSNIDWQKLQSISRDINNNYVSNDFYEIDLALRMENNTDSINRTWILDNIPYYLKDYDVFLNNIKNIPFINSTNNTNFQTGILWDYSDGNTQYNGTQDLVFFTIVNINQTGIHGNYDYELKIPANLRYYKQPNTATIALYTELK